MKRFRIDFSYGRYFFDERADGDWVSFDDHAAEVHELHDRLTQVMLERDALDRTCAALALLLYGNPLPHGNGV